jgi:hypothetical protein
MLKGFPIGYAMEYINQYHAAVGTELRDMLAEMSKGWDPENLNRTLAEVWTVNNDARNYVVFGDPAVRLTVGDAPESPRRALPETAPAAAGSTAGASPP